MKVLMLNGSSKPNGNTFRSLVEVGEQLKKEGIDYEIFQTGAGPVRDCIGCGQCAKRCPMNNVAIKDGKPVWGRNCTHCMACICYCPVSAIEYGKKSVGQPRYHFEAL